MCTLNSINANRDHAFFCSKQDFSFFLLIPQLFPGSILLPPVRGLDVPACVSVVDTRLPNDPLFCTHLVASSPTDDVPLNWTSDDSDTEQLISAAENLISVGATANDRTAEIQSSNGPDLSAGASGEPYPSKFSVEESDPGDLALSGSLQGADLLVVRLSGDAVLEEINGQMVYRVLPRILESLRRNLSEPAASVSSSEKLKHQASAPANLQSAAMTEERTAADENVLITSKVAAECQVSLVASYQQVPGSENTKFSTVSHNNNRETHDRLPFGGFFSISDKALDFPEVPSTDGLLATNAQRQLEVVSASTATNFVSHLTSTSPNPAHQEATFSGAGNPGLPSETLFQAPSWSMVAPQPLAAVQGARPKIPLATSLIPIFVEQETLSEDEDVKYDRSSSSAVASLSRSVPMVISGGGNGSVSNIISQFPALTISGSPAGDRPMVSDAGLLAELDLRNTEGLVSIKLKFSFTTEFVRHS